MGSDEHSVVSTENKAKAFATFFAWWRKDIPADVSYKYWRDVHAIWAARTPGFYQYRQFHLGHVDASLLSDLEGVETDLPKEEQPNGIAHIGYSSSFIAKLLRKPFALKQADEDDVYFVSRNTYQRSALPLSRTYIDKANNPEPNGVVEHPRYVLALKKSKKVSDEEFRRYITRNICDAWSGNETVQRLRLELLARHVDAPTSPKGVEHAWADDKQYQAWIDLGLTQGAELSVLFSQLADFADNISAVHAYPVREIYTIVYGGKPTLVGLRGYPAVQIIEDVGAEFQKSKQVLKFTYGSVINGGKLLAPSVYVVIISVLVVIGVLLFSL